MSSKSFFLITICLLKILDHLSWWVSQSPDFVDCNLINIVCLSLSSVLCTSYKLIVASRGFIWSRFDLGEEDFFVDRVVFFIEKHILSRQLFLCWQQPVRLSSSGVAKWWYFSSIIPSSCIVEMLLHRETSLYQFLLPHGIFMGNARYSLQ